MLSLVIAVIVGAVLGVLADRHSLQAVQAWKIARAAGASIPSAFLRAVLVLFVGSRS